jgi:hypothetical protein
MKIDNFEKVVVAPQIVIYKNIFKQSSQLIEHLDSNQCIFGEWNNWFVQGYRKGPDEEYLPKLYEKDIYLAIKQKLLIQNFFDIAEFIRSDYFNDYNQSNSIWPDFIKDWSFLLKSPAEGYDFDAFKWSNDQVAKRNLDIGDIMMPYHVDDWDKHGDQDISYKKNIVTINVYLNDDYEGGEICAYDLNTNKNYVYKPSAGDAVVMPSHSPFYHAVKFFKGADRYFIRTFFKYPYTGSKGSKDKLEIFSNIQSYVDKDLQTLSVNAEEVIVK